MNDLFHAIPEGCHSTTNVYQWKPTHFWSFKRFRQLGTVKSSGTFVGSQKESSASAVSGWPATLWQICATIWRNHAESLRSFTISVRRSLLHDKCVRDAPLAKSARASESAKWHQVLVKVTKQPKGKHPSPNYPKIYHLSILHIFKGVSYFKKHSLGNAKLPSLHSSPSSKSGLHPKRAPPKEPTNTGQKLSGPANLGVDAVLQTNL